MSKLGCKCGHSMRDGTDKIPYKGFVFSDRELHEHIEVFSEVLFELLQQDSEENVGAWMEKYYPNYPGCPVKELIGVYLLDQFHEQSALAYECVKCGNISIETGKESNVFTQYQPITEKYNGILTVADPTDNSE